MELGSLPMQGTTSALLDSPRVPCYNGEMERVPRLYYMVLLATFLLACSGGSTDPNPAPSPPGSTHTSDLNGIWICRDASQIEGTVGGIDVGQLLEPLMNPFAVFVYHKK